MLQFALGVVTGSALTASALVFLLSRKGKQEDHRAAEDEPNEHQPKHQQDNSANDGLLLDAAIRQLSSTSTTTNAELELLSIDELEALFQKRSKETRLRVKDIEGSRHLLADLSKAFASLSRDLAKLSAYALARKKEREVDEHECGQLENDLTNPSHRWLSLAIALNAFSNDLESLSLFLSGGSAVAAASLAEEAGLLEKKLVSEGTKVLQKAKECASVVEARGRDRDVAIKKKDGANGDKDLEKRLAKVEDAEENLSESRAALFQAQEDLTQFLPRVSADLKNTSLRITSEQQKLFLQLAKKLAALHGMGVGSASRLEKVLLRVASTESDEQLLRVLQEQRQEQRQEQQQHSVKAKANGGLEMGTEATAALAASGLLHLPQLPSSFAESVGTETCVWFNAILGRAYRDAAASTLFHEWACSRATNALNKGKLPPLVSPFAVTRVELGAQPPILTNVRWAPSKEEGGACVRADVLYTSGVRVELQTVVTLGAAITVRLTVQLSELRGTVRFGCHRSNSFLLFEEMPHVLISASSEVGERFRIDVAALSDLAVGKIRKAIRNRLVSPNSHAFRLIWPRSWWPEDCQGLFLPAPTLAAAQVIDPTESGPATPRAQKSNSSSENHTADSSAGGSGSDSPVVSPSPIQQETLKSKPGEGLASRLSGWAQKAGQSRLGEKIKAGLAKVRTAGQGQGQGQSTSGPSVQDDNKDDSSLQEGEEGEVAAE